VDVTINLSDITSDILSLHKEELKKYTGIVSPDYPVFITGSDKIRLMEYCMAKKLPCPISMEMNQETLPRVASDIGFPAIIKPTRAVGAIGVTRVNNERELEEKYVSLKADHDSLLVQQYIPVEGGKQYMAEAFVDDHGKMQVCVVIEKSRIYPIKAGTSSANVTVKHAQIEQITRLLLEGLNWRGPADVDFIIDTRDNSPKILEINPRVTAGIKIGFKAGIDYADLYLKLALGKKIEEKKDYKAGLYCRNFFLEVLWFIAADRSMRRNTDPPFFKVFGKDMSDQVFSIDDPFTGLGFFLNMLRKYLNLKNFKAKFFR
jgi:predicted ATP-grasp superfamily ATP-dependent carboligase